jgi:hypothetical protein
LVGEGSYAKAPFIIGDQEDEGTLFALFQFNITAIAQLVNYISTFFFHSATESQIEEWLHYIPISQPMDHHFEHSFSTNGILNLSAWQQFLVT